MGNSRNNQFVSFKLCAVLSHMGFPGGSDSKESACNAGNADLLEKKLLPFSCLENPMGRGAWRATIHGVENSPTRLRD